MMLNPTYRRGTWMTLRRRTAMALLLPALVMAIGTSARGDAYYTEPPMYDLRPAPDKEMSLDCIGATGIQARIYPGVVLKVEGVMEGSPAQGLVEVGQIITAVNGVALQGINPFVALGKALTHAEATDGKLAFEVKSDPDAAARIVTVTVPVLGAYSDTWPLNCDKSAKIIAQAAEHYARDPKFRDKYFHDKSEDGGIPSALACLFLLSTGDDQYLPVVRDYFAKFPKDVSEIGDHTWNNGYNGIACAEYYLRTGDKDVLPILQYYCDNARDRQFFGSGWGHWGTVINPGYVAGGLLNAAGAQVLTTLLLGKECGVKVDDATLLGALRFWYRFVGHGAVPYGDHRGEGGLGSNGKDGMAAAAMRVAMGAEGNPAIYEHALKRLSMSTLASYPSLVRGHGDEGRGDGIWRGIASAYMLDYKPQTYHDAMNDLTWWYDLSRRPDGALGMATCQRFDDVGSGAGVAMAYTAPLKTLRITGAPRSRHAVDFELPDHLWGNEADLAFHAIEHHDKYAQFGGEEPIHVPFYTLGNAYRKPDLTHVSREEMLKNVYHQDYMIRAQAAMALRTTGAFDDLERLLGDEDPRVRRAALDGMIDYRYWFHLGKSPMKADQITPGMVSAIVGMLKDPDEAIYVVDGALSAMSLMSPDTIGEHLDAIRPWTAHEEWWLRQSSFRALAAAAEDEQLLPIVLPAMLDMMMRETHTMPRQGMTQQLNQMLQKHKTSSPAGQQIVATFIKAAGERELLPGPRGKEGEYDIGQSVDVLLRQAPDRSLDTARTVLARFSDLTTGRILATADGLLDAMDKVPPDQREALADLLYNDYRAALIERMKAEGSNLAMVNTILSLTAIRHPEAGWRELGKETYAEREWRYTSFEPRGDDVLHRREGKRFRDITLPGEFTGWFKPDFDDAGWKRGLAPIGTGEYKRGNMISESRSDWGDDEFLFLRTTFEVDALDFDYYRLRILANQGYDIYLNGQKIHTYIWWQNEPVYQMIMLNPGQVKALKQGVNHLAVRAGSAYPKGEHVGRIDVYLEGLHERDLLGR